MQLRIALRQRFRRDWPTSLAFIAILGLTIGLAGSWLAIAYPVLSGGMPYPEPGRLVAIESLKKGQRGGLGWLTLEDLRSGTSAESMAAYLPRTWGFQTDPRGHVEVVLSEQVTGEFFDTLGVRPLLGESLERQHEQAGHQAFVWMSHAAWTRLLGGDPAAVSKTVWLNATPYRVAGVLPDSFAFPHRGESPDIYIPLNREDFFKRGTGALDAVVRLKRGAALAQFSSELDARAQALAGEFPASNRDVWFVATPLGNFLLGERLGLLKWLLAAVGILLMISIANASGVWLAQWLKQQRHAAIKRSLGATTTRVVLEQCLQAGILGVAAAACGLAGAQALLVLLRVSNLTGPEMARFELWHPASITPALAAGLATLALLSSLTAALLPMIAKTRSSSLTRLGLAVVQLTLTGTLAYSGILVWRNVENLVEADRGFRTEQILISGIGIPEAVYNTDEKTIRFHQRAIAELSNVPGVSAAAGGASMPVNDWRTRFQVDDDHSPADQQQIARLGVASPGLLKMLGIPLRMGRGFEASDGWNAPRVALVNEAFVRRFMGANEPLGHRVRFNFYSGVAAKPYTDHIIAGVVGDTLNRDLALSSEPQILISSDQIAMDGFHYFIQSSLPAESLKQAVAQAIWKVDPAIERVRLTPLAAYVERSLMSRRTLSLLLAWFGVIALAMVGLGLASSLTATFLEMTRELGIRSALGATPARLAYEATRWGSAAIVMSWVLTLPLCFVVGRRVVFDRLPVGFDGVSWLVAGLVLGVIGVVAGLIPASRAALIDPAATLREQ